MKNTDDKKIYMREYRNIPEVKAKKKAYNKAYTKSSYIKKKKVEDGME